MKLIRYIRLNFFSRAARSWWKTYVTKSDIFIGLYHFTLIAIGLHLLLFFRPVLPLLAVFTIATLSFIYAIYHAGRKIMQFVLTDLYPNNVLTGYFMIGVGGLIFGLAILLPSFIAIATIVDKPLGFFSYLITYAYAYPVWSFFLVMRSVKRDEDDKPS